ncbi:MAG TPA: hypothetical protein VKB88_32535 [Bryobacteraceae bacterium]|nr:hypothetical protein [Bryobacteraceae bacterium]
MPEQNHLSDRDFVAQLRLAVDGYLASIDRWEAAYQNYYRLPGYSDDLQQEHREYAARRRELEGLLPRARRLCLKHQCREAFSGLLRISLGRYAPQVRNDSAISRSERNAAAECLVELSAACQEWTGDDKPPRREPAKGSLLQRIVGFFY